MNSKGLIMSYTSDVAGFFTSLPLVVRNTLAEYKKSIHDNRFLKYKEYLVNHETTKTTKFDQYRWDIKPYVFCSDVYGEDYQYIYPVILTVNTIKSIHDFIQDNFKDLLVYTPSINTIQAVLGKK